MWSLLCFMIFSVIHPSESGCSGGADRCEWVPWNPWGSCHGSCGGGYRTRSRSACCKSDIEFDECMKRCGMNSDDSREVSSCNNNCYHGGRFQYERTSKYTFGRCICTPKYDGSCCDEPLCGWDGRWCWPGTCSYSNYERYCNCERDFQKQKNGSHTTCQLSKPPTLKTCIAGLENINGDAVNTTTTGRCSDAQSVYTNLQPHRLSFTIASSFSVQVNGEPSKNRIKEWLFGIVDNSVQVLKRDLRDNKHFVKEQFYHERPACDNAVSDRHPKQFASCTGTLVPRQRLGNGESICINFVPYAGGFLTTNDNLTETYKRTKTSRELCFMYDNHAPDHCTGSTSCCTSMLHLSRRVTDNPNIDVIFSSWRDPVPIGGSSKKASGIKKFVATVLRVEELDRTTLVMKYPGSSTRTIPSDGTHTNFKLPVEPALYAVLLEVHDVAGNVRMARRFVLYDNSSSVAILPTKLLQSLTASSKTNYTWQVNHGPTCFNWTGRYYNTEHVNINLLRRIKSDGNITSSYDQTEGLIPISGTQNIDGIVRFDYTWKHENGTYRTYSTVPDISTQSFCENLLLSDGQTYTFKIKPIDINSRYIEETSVLHIDRSPPSIDNIWVVRDGYRQLFVHNSSDLSKMSLQFEALDLHSGLSSIHWKLGASDGSDDLGEGSVAVNRINGSCVEDKCYCPKVGAVCEQYIYTVGLNKLVDTRTNKGQHNRNYYFSIIVTNNAKLVNIEHLDVLTDDSPPEEGVIQEGSAGSPDVDYTSENEITINWHGYIDHESGIKLYRVGLSDRCLSKTELDQLNNTSNNTQLIETRKNTEKFRLDADGFYISSILAYNNAMEPSKVVCSDGLQKDSTAPLIVNVTLKHSKVMELFACDSTGPWHVRSDLTRVSLIPTDICTKRCPLSTFQYLQSLPEVTINSSDKDVADYLCANLPVEVDNWYIYIPSNNIDMSWRSLDNDSQIRREEVGFASDPSSISSPDIEVYRDTHGHSRYHNVHEGIDRGYPFYIFIRTANKAGMEKALALGPIVIDDTPPINQQRLHVHLEQTDDKVYCSWDNQTFIDPEQKHAVDYVLYKIGAGEKFFTPLLQIPPKEKCIRKDLIYCVHYPISKLQRQDEEKSLQFFFELYVYNMAGHFTTVRSSTFELPSQFRPGNGHIFDIDPSFIPLSSPELDSKLEDVDFHISVGKICVMWTGFNHHRNVTFQIGVGTKPMSDDTIPFGAAENTENFKCLTSSTLQSNRKYFVTINATCSAGSRIVSSDGVYIMDQTNIQDFIKVNVGINCNAARRINLEKQKKENSTSLTFVSQTPLTIGHGYTIESKAAIPLDEIIISDDALWVDKSRVADGKLRKRFVALRHTVSFTILTRNDSEKDLFNMTLLDCFENITTTSAVDSVYVSLSLHANISNLITEYKTSVFQDNCTDGRTTRLSCLMQHSETQVSGTERVFKLTNLTLLDGTAYRIGVSLCFRHICLQAVFSLRFLVQSIPPTTNQINATINQENETCLDVDLGWTKFNCIRTLPFSEKYEWSLTLSTNAEGMLTKWKPVRLGDGAQDENVTVQQCVNVPVYLHRHMYACIRVMCESGAISTTCTPLEVPHPNEYKHRHVYELDARNPSMNDIKNNLHAKFLGETLPLLHKLDIDFCTKDTMLLGAIPNADERNITWYLLKDKNIPSRPCELSDNCIKSVTSSGGYVTLHKTQLVPGTKYYICARSNRTVIERELFNEIQEKINECGNGFLIDDIPPTPGHVTIINQHRGFLNSQSEMVISWEGFKDRLSLSYSNFSSSIYSYSYAIGTSPGSIDVLPFSSAGLSHSVKVRGLYLQNGVKYYATVRAMDHVNLSTEAISAAVGVDVTPPDAGTVTVGGALRHKYIMATQHLNVYWNGFEDKESGISQSYLGIGDQPNIDNILPFYVLTEQFADLSRNVFLDGFTYYAILKVVNAAGHWTTVSSDPFILDSSPPQRGVVREGNSLQSSDVDFQNFTSSLTCHWEAFDDPHSGIQFYRVGLGTNPGQFDIYMLTEVGLRTEMTWRTHFKAGEKYFSTVEACNGARLCTRHHSDGIILDDSSPVPGHVHVGISGKHESYQSHRNSISAHWVGFEDPQSDIHHFEWCIALQRNTCDVFPFTNILLSQSGFKTQLNLPLKQNIFVRIKAYNNVGMYTEAISDSFRIDDTHPVLLARPHFVLKDMQISHLDQTQWEHSLIHLAWKYSDQDSPIVKHVVRLVTHHDGKVRKETIELGNEDKVTIQMPEHDVLLNGDKYWATVTACNAAGLCANSTSEELLIDSTPPQLGGFKPPMTWLNEGNVSRIYLSWYGFSDVESDIVKYMITVSTKYSGSDLSRGIVAIIAKNKTVNGSSILLHNTISEGDKFILSIWAINGVGLRSDIGKVTVTALKTDKKGSKGILKLQKHSCVSHYCNRDCTCAVVGEKCEKRARNLTCVDVQNKPDYQNIHVLVGMRSNHQAVTASSSCISAHWILEKNRTKLQIQRFEWSIGIGKPGDGIFDGPLAKEWFDVDLQTNLTFCMPANRPLVYSENYTVFVKAWYSENESQVFSSAPVTIDTTPPDIVRGKHIYVSTDYCVSDVYFITNITSIHVCWKTVFKDRISGIQKYFVMAGTSPFGDDLIPVTDYGVAERAVSNNLPMSPGTKYYFTVRVLNYVGLVTSLASDGIVLDIEPPFDGVVFNTDHHKNVEFQASLSVIGTSWHGFGDHHSHIHHYSVWVTEVATGRIVIIDENVGIRTSVVFNDTTLHQGESYKASVQAFDAAGYASSVIDSETVTVDSTAPQSFTCRNFTDVKTLNNLTLGPSDISFATMLKKDNFYKIKLGLESLDYFSAVQISIGYHVMVLQMAENADHSKETEMSFLSPYNGTTDFSINFKEPIKNKEVKIRLFECLDMDLNATESPIDVMQFSHSQISVCSRILDLESGIRSIEVGIGTVEGGFQVYPLTPVPLENHIVIEHSSPHCTKLYVTAVARNHAGLMTTFDSNEIVVDHTPPKITNVEAEMNLFQFENSTEQRIAQVKILGHIQDKESGIKSCTCIIELHRMAAGKVTTADGETIVSCLFDNNNVTVRHGAVIIPSIVCINNVELIARASGPLLRASFRQPSAEDAFLQILPDNEISYEAANYGLSFNETLQSSVSSVHARWTGFHDITGIDHYAYTLTTGNTTFAMDTLHDSRTTAVVTDVLLEDGQTYTMLVEAVNTGGVHSEPVASSFKVDSRTPQMSGENVRIYRKENGSIVLDWGSVFDRRNGMKLIYEINIGTREGYSELLNRFETIVTAVSLPETDTDSVWMSVCARYTTGKYNCNRGTVVI